MRRWLLLSARMLPVAMLCGPAAAQALAGSEWRPLRIGATMISERGAPFVQFKAEGALLVSSG